MKRILLSALFSLSILFANAQCQAAYTYTLTNGNTISVTDMSTFSMPSAYYQWFYGDGNSGFTNTPAPYTYPYKGTYNFCLLLKDTLPTTCSSTKCDTIVVTNAPNPPCFSNFTATPDPTGMVYFSCPYNMKKFIWNFGDGTSDTTSQQQVHHMYTSYATYSVCLTSITPLDDSCSTCKLITSSPCTGMNLKDSFAFSINVATVNFTAICSGASSAQYLWNFADGTTSTMQNPPPHTYASNSSYNVCLSYADTNGCSRSYCQYVHITAIPPPPCVAQFTYHPDTMGGLLFQDISITNVISRNWTFPGGAPSTGTTMYENVTYPPGTYSVTLNVTNQSGLQCSITKTVTNGSNCTGVQSSFTMQPDTTPHVWIVNNTSQGAPPVTYTWNWGDGTPATTGTAPTHTYAQTGWYKITLDLVDANGCGASYSHYDTLYKYASTNSMITMHVADHTTMNVNDLSLEEAGISIFPNPSTGKFSINSSHLTINTAEVYNCFGQIVDLQHRKELKTIDLTGHPAGIYWIRLRSDGKLITGKIALFR